MAKDYIRTVMNNGNVVLSNMLDSYTGEYVEYIKVQNPAGVTPDGVIYRQLGTAEFGTEIFKRVFNTYVNVKWFGAKGDFSDDTNTGTDDTTAIQNAVNTLISIGGGTLFFPVGRYLINGTIYINPLNGESVQLLGAGGTNRNVNTLFTSTLVTTVSDHDIIRTNLDFDGNAVLPADQQWGSFSVKSLNFKTKAGATGVNGIRNFRTRQSISDVSGFGLDYLIIQDDRDASNNLNYCDQSSYINLRFSQMNYSGIKLMRADSSYVNGFYFENPRETVKHAIEIERSSGVRFSELLLWSPTDFTPISGGSYLRVVFCNAISVETSHLERVFFETGFDVIGTNGFKISGLETKFSSNDMFHFRSGTFGCLIENWYSHEIKNGSTYDIRVSNTNTSNITYKNCKFQAYEAGAIRNIRIFAVDAPFSVRDLLRDAVFSTSTTSPANVNITESSSTVFLNNLVSENKNITLPDALPNTGGEIIIQNRNVSVFDWVFTNPPRDYLGNTIVNMPRNTTLTLKSIGGNWRVVARYEAYSTPVSRLAANDNDIIINSNIIVFLPSITADRLITLPSAANATADQPIKLFNTNNSAFSWQLNVPVLDLSNDPVTTLPNKTSVELVSDGVNWRILSIYYDDILPVTLVGTNIDFSTIPPDGIIQQDIAADTTYTFSNRIPGKKIEFSILNTAAVDVTINFSGGVVIADSNIIPAGKEAMVSIVAVRTSYRIGIAIQS